MPSKTIVISMELVDLLDSKRATGQSYDGIIRQLLGVAPNPKVKNPVIEHPDYAKLKALAVGQMCLLEFVRPAPPAIPVGDGPNGELTADQKRVLSTDMSPTNLRHLAQVIRRVQEREGYRLHVEGTPRGQKVFRIA